MASKVNVKFLVVLSTVLVGVFVAVAATAVIVLRKDASDHYDTGMKLMAEGNARQAERAFSKAVNKEMTNITYLEAWENALETMVPESRAEFEDSFQEYRGLQRQLSTVDPFNVERAEDFLAFNWQMVQGSRAVETHRNMRSTAEDVLNNFRQANRPESEWASLRMYSALAGVEIIRLTEVPDADLRESVKRDLDAAQAARPGDLDLARAAADWHLIEIRQMPGGTDAPAAKEAIRQARGVLQAAVAEASDSADARLTALRADWLPAFRLALGEELLDREATLDRLGGIGERIKQAESATASFELMQRFWQTEAEASGRRDVPITRDVLDHLIESRPDDVMLLRLLAVIQQTARQFADAIATWQRIIDLPDRAVSLNGFRLLNMRDDGVFAQSGLAFDRWLANDDEAVRTEMVALLESRNQTLSQRLPPASPRLLLSTARVAFANQRLDEARRQLVRYVEESPVENPQALRMLSRIALSRNNLGEARTRLERVVALDRNDIPARIELAEVTAQIGDVERAIELYEEIVRIIPNQDRLNERLARLRAISGDGGTGDPIQDEMIRAAQVARGSGIEPGDPQRALDMINSLEPSTEPRLVRDRMQYLLMLDRVAEAREALQAGLTANPNDDQLSRLRPLLDAQSTIEVSEILIDLGSASEPRKLVAKGELRRRAGEIERGNQLLAQAMEAAPDDAAVIESSFRAAMADGRGEDAARLAARAVELDLDGVGGLSFRARQMMSFGDPEEARALLENAVEQRPDSVPMLRLLAQQQLATGQTPQAVATLESALALRGNDTGVLGDYVTALVRSDRTQLALQTLRDRESAVVGSDRLIEMRLQLESMVGDQDEVIRVREDIAIDDPDNASNLIQLATAYIDLGRWDQAVATIDRLRELAPGLAPTELQARVAAGQGDLAAARAVYRDEIRRLLTESADADAGPTYASLGQLLLSLGDVEGGLEALRTARRWERPETMPIERQLAEALFRVQRYDEAAESFRTLVDAGMDDDSRYLTRRLAETHIRLGQLDEAEALLVGLNDLEERDQTILVLRAEVAQARGETTEARELLDRATRLFPQSSLVFQRRAALFAGLAEQNNNTRLIRDAIDDLDTAVRLDPQNSSVYRTRGALKIRIGDRDAAFSDLAEAARLNPSDTRLVVGVIAALVDSDDAARAMSLADEIVEVRNDIETLVAFGDVFSSRGEVRRSRSYYERAWERVQTIEVARRYVRALLDDQPKRYAEVQQVLGALGAEIESDPAMLLARAETLVQRGRMDLAVSDAVRAFGLVEENPDAIQAWFTRTREVLGDGSSDFAPVLAGIGSVGPRAAWSAYFRGVIGLEASRSAEVERAVAGLGSLLSDQAPPAASRFAAEALSRHFTEGEQHERALQALLAVESRFPEDWQLHNNIAYILTERLDRPSEAVDHAERAASLNPRVPEILDTLGWTYAKLSRLDEAQETLERALAQVGRTPTRAIILAHLAHVRLETEDTDGARAALEDFRSLVRDGIEPAESYKQLAEETSRRIASQG